MAIDLYEQREGAMDGPEFWRPVPAPVLLEMLLYSTDGASRGLLCRHWDEERMEFRIDGAWAEVPPPHGIGVVVCMEGKWYRLATVVTPIEKPKIIQESTQ